MLSRLAYCLFFSVAADVLWCRVVILVGLPIVKEVMVIGPFVHDPPIPGNLIEVILHLYEPP